MSAAPSAWCASLARSVAVCGVCDSAASARRWSTRRTSGVTESSIARRASSCRNATLDSAASRAPDRRHSSSVPGGLSVIASSSHISACWGMIATASSSARAAALSGAARASTASRTVSGTASWPAASTSVAKNGFPPVRSCSRSGLTTEPRASSATASRDSPVSPRWVVLPTGRTPRTRRNGCIRPTSSSR